MAHKWKMLFFQLMPAFFFLLLWQIYIAVKPNAAFYYGSPAGIVTEFNQLLKQGQLLTDAGITAMEALLGFIAGMGLGTLTGLSLWASRSAYNIARPYLIALGALPVFALGPILIFWFGTGILSKIVIGFLSTFVVALIQAYSGAQQCDKNLLMLMEAFGGNRYQIFRKVIVPSSLIWVLASTRINISMALLGAFVGEFISSRAGLGHLIIVAEGLFNINQIWVGVICLVIIALIFNLLTRPLEKWASKWK